MGCSANTTSQKINEYQNMSQDISSDTQILKLISSIQDSNIKGQTTVVRSNIYEMKLNALQYAQSCRNPIQVVEKLLQLLNSSKTGLSPCHLKEIAHVTQLYIHQVYIHQKQGLKITQSLQLSWLEIITSIRNLIYNSIEKIELEFELDCIEACVKTFNVAQQDNNNQIFNYISLIGKSTTGDHNKIDYSQIISQSKDLICKFGEFSKNKIKYQWILPVMTNYYKLYILKDRPDQMNTIIEQICPLKEWHISYAGLDVIESYLDQQTTLIIPIIDLFTKLSSYNGENNDKNSWKIRDKVAKICIRVREPHATYLSELFINMLSNEKNVNVRNTLENEEYIKRQQKQLRECWEKNQVNQQSELSTECQKLNEINKILQENTEISIEQRNFYNQIMMNAKQKIQTLEKLDSLLDVKTQGLETLQSAVLQQENIIEQITHSFIKVEKAISGRTAQELVDYIYDYYTKESEMWKARLSMYIPEKAVISINDIANIQSAIDVDQNFLNFIDDNNKKVLLIQGEAGTGKTIYCQYVITQLLESKLIVPIFISLPYLQNWEKQMVEETLIELRFTHTEILTLQQSRIQLLLIVDGYDEVRSYKRLYDSNNLLNWNCKALFTCRSSHLACDKYYYKYFISQKFDYEIQFCELVLVHFNNNQIQGYLQRFCLKLESNSKYSSEWKDWNTYLKYIDIIPGLCHLVENPFILSMIVKVLPNIILKNNINQTLLSLDLYEEFVQQWFELEEERMFINNVSTDIINLKKEYYDYSQKLASKMMDVAKTVVEYKNEDKQNPWREFFDPNNSKLSTIRRGAPLTMSSRFYSFIHKSIQEYFVAKNGQYSVTLLINSCNEKTLDCSINTHNITDKGVFDFYSQIIQRFPEFKQQLYKVIELSKINSKVSIAAANAITILNYINESFQNADFRNIKIPGANLGLAMMQNIDLRGADLSNVDFQSAWLQKAKFDGANMLNLVRKQVQIQVLQLIKQFTIRHNNYVLAQLAIQIWMFLKGKSFKFITQKHYRILLFQRIIKILWPIQCLVQMMSIQ
ncbi:Pentapeptide_repeats-containing protein [Hexamita inflata]|uniref:Pentapeptide_repeats-containing protein n=1 Tax=Hexamita inflata TaxID=28002 RepID=A0ABP1HI96_9EUKA